uniref:Uncharacterized protein n=1 Tax=Rhizophora mucronata TaxID=61149 RepID=A0A2P2P1X2_RHIMU
MTFIEILLANLVTISSKSGLSPGDLQLSSSSFTFNRFSCFF